MSEDNKNIFVTSNNQMGGITAGTVNFGNRQRVMNEKLGEGLMSNIPNDKEVTVTAVMGDGEAFEFANQVLEWLKNNGYTNVKGVDQAVFPKPITKQTIVQKGEGFHVIIGTNI